MQRKVEGSPNVETMLVAVRELRKEREKVKELQTQKTEQRTAIGKISPVKDIPSSNRQKIVQLVIIIKILLRFLVHADQRIARLEQQLKDLRSAAVGATPEGLLQVKRTFETSNNHIVSRKILDNFFINFLILIISISVVAY